MTRSALAALSLSALVFGAAPALATGNQPNAANLYNQTDMRSIGIQNRSGANITEAQVKTTDGKVWNLGQGGVPRNQATQIMVPARDCIAAISVRLSDGRHLDTHGMDDCRNTKIVVGDEGISIPQEAVPGAKQHGTPG